MFGEILLSEIICGSGNMSGVICLDGKIGITKINCWNIEILMSCTYGGILKSDTAE